MGGGGDFLSSLFNAIGETFKAGAAVDQAKLANERARHERELAFYALEQQDEQSKLSFILGDAKAEQNILIVVLLFVAVVIGLIVFKSGK